jgi:hypothetical protein
MKKTLIATSLALFATVASAANFASVDVERVEDNKGAVSQAQYVRVGKDMGKLSLGLQARTATFDKGGMLNSLEATVGSGFKVMGLPVDAYAGVGHDNGFNGGRSFQYGLVGATTGAKMGPFWSFAGVKTRVNWNDKNPAQTVGFAGLSYPLRKDVSVHVGASKSWGDIKETAHGVGVRVSF